MELRQEVERILGERVRPILREHGGEIRLLDCFDGVVSVELLGTCSGCPSADLSARDFVEDILRAVLPDVESVEIKNRVSRELLDMACSILGYER